MSRFLLRLLTAAAFAIGAASLPVVGADDAKPPDWSKFATHSDVVGTVVEADEEGVTLRVSRIELTGSGGRRGRVSVKENAEDHVLKYADGGLVRWKKLPPKLDENGKKVNHTPKEMDALRKPLGAPGYAAERTDLIAGHIVELKLVRPRSVPAAKATPDDLRIKYAIIIGEAATPPVKERK